MPETKKKRTRAQIQEEARKKQKKRMQEALKKKVPVTCFAYGCNRFEGVYMAPDDPEVHTWRCSHCIATERRDKAAFAKHGEEYLKMAEELESPECFECGEPNEQCICPACGSCDAPSRAVCRCGQYFAAYGSTGKDPMQVIKLPDPYKAAVEDVRDDLREEREELYNEMQQEKLKETKKLIMEKAQRNPLANMELPEPDLLTSTERYAAMRGIGKVPKVRKKAKPNKKSPFQDLILEEPSWK